MHDSDEEKNGAWCDICGGYHGGACPQEPEEEEPSGKTLADFAGSDKAFKRPQHGFPYAFDGSRHLKEIINGKTFWPRLTAEDLTATDWEEVE